MAKFEKVSRWADSDINMPVRKTAHSAGYDFEAVKDILIEPYQHLSNIIMNSSAYEPKTLSEISNITKLNMAKPTLVSTGMKCKLADNEYLELSIRSSSPLKYWLVLANSVGIIDADYYGNVDNDGHIQFQVINFGPRKICLKKGDIIGQGIIKKYYTTDDDAAEGERVGGFGSTTKEEKK